MCRGDSARGTTPVLRAHRRPSVAPETEVPERMATSHDVAATLMGGKRQNSARQMKEQ